MQGNGGRRKRNLCGIMWKYRKVLIVVCTVGCILLSEMSEGFFVAAAGAPGPDTSDSAGDMGPSARDTQSGVGNKGLSAWDGSGNGGFSAQDTSDGTGRTAQDGDAAAGSTGLTAQDTSGGTGQSGTASQGDAGGKESGTEEGDSDDGTAQGMSDAGGMSNLVIDNKNVYEGMESPYSKGYMPKIDGNKAVVVLPLLAKEKLSGNRMTVALRLGEGENLPFVYKNYEKVVKLGKHKTKKGGKREECYLAAFSLTLKSERYNGSYPVTFAVTAKDKSGNEIYQEFSVYVTITDGKDLTADGGGTDGAGDETPQFAPKVLIQTYEFSRNEILCGEKFTARLTLYNTSGINAAKNMAITIQPGENLELLSRTDSDYVSQLEAGESCTIQFAFRVLATAPSGQYDIGVTLDYADVKGNPYTMQEVVKVSAKQKTSIEVAPVRVPGSLQLGETIELQAQVMNLGKGKLYNVRAMLEAEGLAPSGMIFIGDIEAGTSMSGSMEVTAEGLSGDSLYGPTQGKIVFYYEDESGKEMTQEQEFETSIIALSDESENKQAEDDTGQWWVIMALISIFLVQAVIIFVMRRRGQEELPEQEQIGEEKADEEENQNIFAASETK